MLLLISLQKKEFSNEAMFIKFNISMLSNPL